MKHTKLPRWFVTATYIVAFTLLLAACGGAETSDTTAASDGETATTAADTAEAAETTSAETTGSDDTAAGGDEAEIDEIRVGLLFPTTGDFSVLGTDQMNGVKIVLDWANENGGINGIPITVVEGDSQSDPGVGATVAQRMIDQDDVDIIIGSYSSAIAQAIVPVVERNDRVLWEVGAVSPTVNADGSDNFLRTVGGSRTYAQADIDFLKEYIAPQMGVDATEVRIAVAHEDGAFGSSVADAIVELAEQEGLNIVARESYPLDSTDLTPVVLRLQEAQPDVLFITPLVADTMLFWEAAQTQGFNVQALIGSAGFSSSSFLENFGAEGVEGVFDVEAPSVEFMNSEGLQPEVKELLDQWREQFKTEYGRPCLVHCGDGLGGAYALVTDVLPRAISESGNVSSEAILAAAAETDIPEGGTPQGFGVRFAQPGEENVGNNVAAQSVIMQWQDGELVVVYPESLAVAEPNFPMPTFEER